ncbi:hypothetical protein [Leptolyngbya sp. GGD]|uniref:hypothetical protein n=1 Tax=Leptolyngbya sp. GGD TaxID=2997907 RepID=UPI00227B08BB|nr:hypothetical protein [Leptolyngbya sp. GGD]MCY6492112.1 hypothetical protein [Leptolyngbya sp. GGD]
MAQRKNSVVLTATALSKLQVLVSTGEFCSLDDAASHIITSVLGSTGQYSLKTDLILPKTDSVSSSTQEYKANTAQNAEKPVQATASSESKPNLAQSLRSI